MSELKPCPFCGKEPAIDNNFAICVNDDCELSDYWSGLEDCSWNTRPIEDALNARIAELEEENDRLQDGWFRDETICPDGSLRPKVSDLLNRIAELSQAVGLITTLKPTMVMDVDHPLDMAKEVEAYVTARIAELEADSVQIQYVCEDELPEGISDEVFSAMYACSTVDFVRVYPYITIDGHKRFLIDFPEVQNA